MRQALLVIVVGGLELLAAMLVPFPPRLVLLHIGCVTMLVGCSMALGWADLLRKREDGTIPLYSYLLFWPWHLFAHAAALKARSFEDPTTEITKGWHIGGWPHNPSSFGQWAAVIDVTCELPRAGASGNYIALPTWDGTAPAVAHIEKGANFAVSMSEHGEVLIHCTAGHSRSATVLAAALVKANLAPNWQAAYLLIKEKRKHAHLIGSQRRALDLWQAEFNSPATAR